MFIKLFNGASPKLDAKLLATALAVFTTTNSLNTGSSNRASATRDGFTLSNAGTGAALWNVTTYGAAFSLPNNSTASLLDLLKRTNAKAVNGKLYCGNKTLINQANVVFSQINVAGDMALIRVSAPGNSVALRQCVLNDRHTATCSKKRSKRRRFSVV